MTVFLVRRCWIVFEHFFLLYSTHSVVKIWWFFLKIYVVQNFSLDRVIPFLGKVCLSSNFHPEYTFFKWCWETDKLPKQFLNKKVWISHLPVSNLKRGCMYVGDLKYKITVNEMKNAGIFLKLSNSQIWKNGIGPL